MKHRGINMYKMVAVVALFITTAWLADIPQAHAQYGYNNNGYYDDYGDYQVFYDELAPYGQWYNDPQYGFVWAPRAGRDFRPYYSNGYWQMTPYGNMWVSGYAWGWAPFHYGRWAMSNMFGWVWIPGSEWGPAWVTWRQGGGYYGWAPMGPGISINISFGSNYYTPDPWWTFIPCGHIYSRDFRTYYAPRRTTTIIRNTTIINNTYVDNRSRTTYVTGPSRSQVETAIRKPVEVVQVNNGSRAGAAGVSRNQISIYRPEITRGKSPNAAPRNVKNLQQSAVDISRTANIGNARNTTPQRNNTSTPVRNGNQQIDSKSNSNRQQNIRPTTPATPQYNLPQQRSSTERNNTQPVQRPSTPVKPQQSPQRQNTPSTPSRQQSNPTTPSRQSTPAKQSAAPRSSASPRATSSSRSSLNTQPNRSVQRPATPSRNTNATPRSGSPSRKTESSAAHRGR